MVEIKTNSEEKKTKKEKNEKKLKEIMDAASFLAIKSKDPKFNKVIKERANY